MVKFRSTSNSFGLISLLRPVMEALLVKRRNGFPTSGDWTFDILHYKSLGLVDPGKVSQNFSTLRRLPSFTAEVLPGVLVHANLCVIPFFKRECNVTL